MNTGRAPLKRTLLKLMRKKCRTKAGFVESSALFSFWFFIRPRAPLDLGVENKARACLWWARTQRNTISTRAAQKQHGINIFRELLYRELTLKRSHIWGLPTFNLIFEALYCMYMNDCTLFSACTDTTPEHKLCSAQSFQPALHQNDVIASIAVCLTKPYSLTQTFKDCRSVEDSLNRCELFHLERTQERDSAQVSLEPVRKSWCFRKDWKNLSKLYVLM